MQRSNDPAPRKPTRSKLIDIEPTEAPDAGGASRSQHERQAHEVRTREARDATDVRDTVHAAARPNSFRERHALKVMGGIMSVMFVLVLVAQVGC